MIGLLDKKKPEVIARRRAHRTKNSALDNTTDTGETSERGMRNDTATPQDTVTEARCCVNRSIVSAILLFFI